MMLAQLVARDDFGRASELLDEALACAIRVGDRIAMSATIGAQAWIATHEGNHARALELAREACRLNILAGQRAAMGPNLVVAAVAATAIQPSETAALLLGARDHVVIGQAIDWWEQLIARTEMTLIHDLGQTRYDELNTRGATLNAEDVTTLLNALPDST
jgi:hypothetical protein